MNDVWARTPVTTDGRTGTVGQHPGLCDSRYLERRGRLVRAARGHRVGDPSPPVTYSEAEHATWRTVHSALTTAHRRHACRDVLEAGADAPVPADRVPQHAEVSAELRPRTGFAFTLAGGFVESRRFLGAMARGYFHAVQFVRHPAIPLYTPEPDVIHDVFGHGIHLTSPRIAGLYRLFGRTALRLRTPEAMALLSRVYWFTLEFGVMREAGEVKAFGAGLLSSYGELGALDRCEVRDLDVRDMIGARDRIPGYQPVLFDVRSLTHLTDTLTAFLEGFDDEAGARLTAAAPADRS
ncbi:phenylalanine 4-monooxygenase [Streptomyces albireticuli]|uniref:phenylalanine 4-monooxygenase n=1 Tax=Streptomyces albireticuli TaxID=1940 RepID=UPI000B441B3F|nr:phenylalanine 4-monooxygenase [Streptomyces albireticuli]